MAKTRIEHDSMGSVKVPIDAYYGAQTARSLEHFSIGKDRMPIALVHALIIVKKAAALVNCKLGKLDEKRAGLIVKAADEALTGKWDAHFPLYVWQTGSGTQTNMNVNEVLSNRALKLAGGRMKKKDLHPNDHVNMSQSSNDAFPTAMHIAAALQLRQGLIPALQHLIQAFAKKEKAFRGIVKVGRTHLQDATPLMLSQEFSGYVALLKRSLARIEEALDGLYDLAIGGTAVGTGLNSHPKFASAMAKKIAELTRLPFRSHPNKFAALSAHDEIVEASSALRAMAVSLMKIANDIRWLGSGPRCGLHELILPENEPGSSIMPGKVNPTQCEAMTMVATQIFGNDTAIAMAGASGHFELNTYKPLMIANLLHSIEILQDASHMFAKYCIDGLKANKSRIGEYIDGCLMMVTALSPVLGYEKCSKIAHLALQRDLSLKEACLRLKLLSSDEFDKFVNPKNMIHP